MALFPLALSGSPVMANAQSSDQCRIVLSISGRASEERRARAEEGRGPKASGGSGQGEEGQEGVLDSGAKEEAPSTSH